MTDVIDLDSKRPHETGKAFCGRCEHDWIAVIPTGTVALECPSCTYFAGALSSEEVAKTAYNLATALSLHTPGTHRCIIFEILVRFAQAINDA